MCCFEIYQAQHLCINKHNICVVTSTTFVYKQAQHLCINKHNICVLTSATFVY